MSQHRANVADHGRGQRPSVDHSDHHPRQRKTSTSKDSDHSGGHALPLTGAHRRMSRMMEPQSMGLGVGRRMSLFRRPSNASFRTDNSSIKAPVKLANTYRMEPKENEKFKVGRAEKLLQSIIDAYFVGEEYEDEKKAGIMAKNLTDVIKNRMKELHLPRYKFVCHVIVGQNTGQDCETASRCLWDVSTDNFATAVFKNGSLFSVASVYACYFE